MEFAFYFDLALRTFLSIRNILEVNISLRHLNILIKYKYSINVYQKNSWLPSEMEYLTCDNFNGENTPARDIDLRSSFINVSFINLCPFNLYVHKKY